MDVVEGLPGESALLRRELARISDRRFARGRVHPPEGALSLAALGLMRGQGSLSAIRRFGDTRPELLAALSRLLRMAKPAGVRQPMPGFTAAPSELPGARMTVASIGRQDHARCPGGRRATAVVAWGQPSRVLALDQARISGHLEEHRAAREWMERVSGSIGMVLAQAQPSMCRVGASRRSRDPGLPGRGPRRRPRKR